MFSRYLNGRTSIISICSFLDLYTVESASFYFVCILDRSLRTSFPIGNPLLSLHLLLRPLYLLRKTSIASTCTDREGKNQSKKDTQGGGRVGGGAFAKNRFQKTRPLRGLMFVTKQSKFAWAAQSTTKRGIGVSSSPPPSPPLPHRHQQTQVWHEKQVCTGHESISFLLSCLTYGTSGQPNSSMFESENQSILYILKQKSSVCSLSPDRTVGRTF